MSKMKNITAMYGVMAALSMENEGYVIGRDVFNEEPIDIQPKPPTGTKEYFFNSSGEFSTESMLKEDVVFKCCAINDKNAVRKFKRWQA
jgi:hypothetical protein